MVGAYAGYDEDDWELLGEYYHFSNSDSAGGGSRASKAWFAQIGHSWGGLTPFVRFEQAALDPADKYFRSQESGRSYQRAALGARYALDPKTSLKLEFSQTREEATSLLDENGADLAFSARRYRRGGFQYSVAF
jgi:hypothetical protein